MGKKYLLITLLSTNLLWVPKVYSDDFDRYYTTITKPFHQCTKNYSKNFADQWKPGEGCRIYNGRWDRGKKQLIRWHINNNKHDGSFKHMLLFKNRDWTDGDTICFGAKFLTDSNKAVWTFKVRWGVNARDNRRNTWSVKLPKDVYSKVTKVKMGYRHCDKVNDSKVWKPIIDGATSVCTTLTSGAGIAACATAGKVAQRINSKGE